MIGYTSDIHLELDMKAQIKKWGNAAALRIPKSLLKELLLDIGSNVDLRQDDGRLVIEPLVRSEPTLEELLEHFPKETLFLDQEDREWLEGKPVGKEAW